jgi:hypothetical protein
MLDFFYFWQESAEQKRQERVTKEAADRHKAFMDEAARQARENQERYDELVRAEYGRDAIDVPVKEVDDPLLLPAPGMPQSIDIAGNEA